ncbi:MAG: hypothetical protein B6I36_08935 [Desulfobacteraceae bacterium 4572_35.1]|nr:MAG: hypothetical protein B6I36_08935 [Desulfobacteraceae bacterium 4572_35.1]
MISPPDVRLLDQPSLSVMDLYGRMFAYTSAKKFVGIQPAMWQCSDESQGIKRSLFGYVYNCPVFNLGRVGALVDEQRLIPAGRHGQDLVIFGGSHIGSNVIDGIGHVDRVSGHTSPCCGMLYRVLKDYLHLYRRAYGLIRLFREGSSFRIEIPYKYLFVPRATTTPQFKLHVEQLVDGNALRDSGNGKVYRLNKEFAKRHEFAVRQLDSVGCAIGDLLESDHFTFVQKLDYDSKEIGDLITTSVFGFMSEVVTSVNPHRRLADINTWRQFHHLVTYLTDHFELRDRNIFIVAGLCLDHSVRLNSIVPQFGFLLEAGQVLTAKYFGPVEINELLNSQEPMLPDYTFMQYAGVG